MENSRGFTLAEVLAVLTIIAILTSITIPLVSKSIKNSKESLYKDQEKIILRSAVNWAEANTDVLPKDNDNEDTLDINLGLLKANGFLVKSLTNPKTGYLYPDDMVINISYNKDNEREDYSNVKYNGNYKFVFVENSGTELGLNTNIKAISLNVCGIDSSNNDISLDVQTCINNNLNLIYEDVNSGTALSYRYNNGNVVSDDDLKTYNYNEHSIKTIDMSKYGFYYVYYNPDSVETDINDSLKIIIINDTEIPSIIFDDNYQTEYYTNSNINLLDNVRCSDNSGYCKIEGLGNITPSIKGKYVITYIVSDNSGNTSKAKKVITIKEHS